MSKISSEAANIQNIAGASKVAVKSGGVLKQGDSVYVRVLSNMGGGKYSVSFAGNRFLVTSQTALNIGKSFSAQVQVQNGTIVLVPDFSQATTITNQSVSVQNYLMALGLPNDAFSQQIVQLFVGMGLKFNSKLEKKIRDIVANFPGQEKEAAEVALALSEKGITPDVKNVMSMLSLLLGKNTNRRSNSDSQNKEDETTFCRENADSKNILKNIYDNPDDILVRKTGLLTLFNHLVKGREHWMVFPIQLEIPSMNGYDKVEGKGNLSILVNLENKTTEKFKIFLKFHEKTYTVVLKCNVVRFCTVPEVLENDRQSAIDLLSSLTNISSENIFYDSQLKDHGFFTEDCAIPIIRTEA